jgi:hypothetical protein
MLRPKGDPVEWAPYPLPGGSTVAVASDDYSSAQIGPVLAVLGRLPHGTEMNLLSVYLATPQRIGGICGNEMMGCYFPFQNRMVVSGSNAPVAGVTRDHVIAHEYGHHIANNRVNGLPWQALDAGTERWATYEHVCEGTQQGGLFPGDEGAHYWQNPGEGFAEAYANLNAPVAGLTWNYSPLLSPDPTAMALIGQDVSQPWTGPQTTVWRGKLGVRHGNAVRTVTTPLDGKLTLQMRGPRDSNFDLSVRGAGRARRSIKRAARDPSGERVDAMVCGQRSVQVEVRARRGAGQFAVTIARP